MGSESSAERLRKQRNKPRTHIKYEVFEDGEKQVKELPFDLGVMGDYSGDNLNRKSLEDRDFAEINSRNFNDKMKNDIKPRLSLELELGNQVQNFDLKFESMEGFSPEMVLKQMGEQIESVGELTRIRRALVELQRLGNTNPQFMKQLEAALGDPQKLQQLAAEFEAGQA